MHRHYLIHKMRKFQLYTYIYTHGIQAVFSQIKIYTLLKILEYQKKNYYQSK